MVDKIPALAIEGIEKMVFSEGDKKFIRLGNYALDFKKKYVFLGFTKNKTQVILGSIHSSGPDGEKYNKKFAKVELRKTSQVKDGKSVPYEYYFIHTEGFRYSEKICDVTPVEALI